ncbi:Maf family protein [Persicirhabdus sediminis]|uniref:dTTP/UTP pyrophosphatase n=1 Tax=Persicirhabdus sediminis TaxID=454144 RepID=A0A8J7MDT8_9BACT|nr:Maf family protein [Persicirhabdus sediminis]MBK1792009.1 septum formation protein Maf [Persicirhabdus sediminis]
MALQLQTKLILASASPRRREILAEAGYHFSIMPSPAEEIHDASIPLEELCELNAKAKAKAIALDHRDACVIGSDTLVCLDGQPLGKPASREEAIATLQKLSGRTHQVCTGVCVIADNMVKCFHCISEVVFKELDLATIEEYISKVNVMDKAGSYAVQERGEMIIKEFRGDFQNIVGLPIKYLEFVLQRFGIEHR